MIVVNRVAWTKFVGSVGAVLNWAIPAAAINNAWKNRDPLKIDPNMTVALVVYSMLFSRWALAIYPTNYPLLVCHISNILAQSNELRRFTVAKWNFRDVKPLPISGENSSVEI